MPSLEIRLAVTTPVTQILFSEIQLAEITQQVETTHSSDMRPVIRTQQVVETPSSVVRQDTTTSLESTIPSLGFGLATQTMKVIATLSLDTELVV
jgi:hypothetical protein